MVILNSQNSQLANRLWGFSSFIANSIEHNYPLVNVGFYKYRNYFEATKNNNFGNYPITTKRTGIGFLDYFYSNIFKNWVSITHKTFGSTPTFYKLYCTKFKEDKTTTLFDLNNASFVNDVKKQKVLVHGWMFRDPINIRKHRDKLLQFFKPVEPYYSQVMDEIAHATKLADVLVGVHIRRGDYATFVNGKWFYTDIQYADMMHQLTRIYANEGKTCAFFVCSNEDINLNNFSGLTLVYKPRHFMVDLYALAKCDVIIGPPSTFSQWAAFYGNKPLVMLLAGNQKLEKPKYNVSLLPDLYFAEKIAYTF
jgi:hypothetical protein